MYFCRYKEVAVLLYYWFYSWNCLIKYYSSSDFEQDNFSACLLILSLLYKTRPVWQNSFSYNRSHAVTPKRKCSKTSTIQGGPPENASIDYGKNTNKRKS